MKGELLYPNVGYFKIKQPLLNLPVGTKVGIADADGREMLYIDTDCGEIELRIDYAAKHPDFFEAVSKEDFIKEKQEYQILRCMQFYGRTREETIRILERLETMYP